MSTEPTHYQEISILLVDDDEVDVMAVKRAFKKLKILNPLIHAHNGEEGLALLRDSTKVKRPYLILLDLNMPRMGGLEMLREIRSDPLLEDSIVFILTTSKADEDKVAAYHEHIAGYIVKQRMEDGFLDAISMLNHYWRIVELPV